MKHIDLINSIIEAEQQAQALADEAREKKRRLRDDLKADAEMLRTDYIEKADQRISLVRERETKQTDEAIEGINMLHKMEMDSMERLYTENRGAWIEQLYALVVERL